MPTGFPSQGAIFPTQPFTTISLGVSTVSRYPKKVPSVFVLPPLLYPPIVFSFGWIDLPPVAGTARRGFLGWLMGQIFPLLLCLTVSFPFLVDAVPLLFFSFFSV